MNDKRYSIWCQPKDGSSNGKFISLLQNNLEYLKHKCEEWNRRFHCWHHEVRELPNNNS